ncbi:MAG: CAP domain-containing protein [Gemmatimonadota bacterium]
MRPSSRSSRWSRLLQGLTGCCLGVGAACDLPFTGPDAVVCPATEGQEVVRLLNEARIEAGLEPLTVDLRLVASAERHALDMSGHDHFSHTGTDGSTVSARVRAAGYDWTHVAENIAAGQTGPEAVVAAWMDSPPHRGNILAPGARHVGLGFEMAPASRYGTWWTLNFGATAGAPQAPDGGCHP